MKQKAYIKNGNPGNAMRDSHKCFAEIKIHSVNSYQPSYPSKKEKGFWGITSCESIIIYK